MISTDALQGGFLSSPLFVNNREQNDKLNKKPLVLKATVLKTIILKLTKNDCFKNDCFLKPIFFNKTIIFENDLFKKK